MSEDPGSNGPTNELSDPLLSSLDQSSLDGSSDQINETLINETESPTELPSEPEKLISSSSILHKRRPPPPPPRHSGIAIPGGTSPVPMPPSSSSSSSSSSITSSPAQSLDKKQKEDIETVKYYLKQALQIKDVQACKDLLTRASTLRMSGELVAQAQTLINDKTSEQRVEEIETLRFYLKQGMELKSRDALVLALSKVDKLQQASPSSATGKRLNTEFFDLVSRARKELLRLNQEEASTIKVYLKQGIEMKNREMLISALERAEKITSVNPELLDPELLKKATQLRADLDLRHLILRILQQAVEAKDPRALTSALSKADALKMGKDIEVVAQADKMLAELKKKESKKIQKKVKKTKKTRDRDFNLFGGELKTAVDRGQGRDVPRICYETIEYLKKNGLMEPGLFRVSGNADLMQLIKELYSNEEEVKLTDVHDAAGVLKQYLRKLPEPLIPFSHYADFIRVGTLSLKDPSRNGKLRELMTKLPKVNLALLTYLMRFLKEVSKNSDVNKMTPDNIAIVFAPNLLRPKLETTTSMMVEMPISIGLIASFISHFDEIFGPDSPTPLGSPTHSNPPSPIPSPSHLSKQDES